MAKSFVIKLPINGIASIKYNHAPYECANAGVTKLGRLFGREFVLQKWLEFISACDVYMNSKSIKPSSFGAFISTSPKIMVPTQRKDMMRWAKTMKRGQFK